MSNLLLLIVFNLPKDRHLVVVGALEYLGHPKSYAGGSLVSW